MTCHTRRGYELQLVKDMTHGSNTNDEYTIEQ